MFELGIRRLIVGAIVGTLCVCASPAWGLDKGAPRNAADPQDGPVALPSAKKSLESIGRPASQGPTFPDSPAPTVEEGEKLQSRIDLLIPQLGDARLEVRDKATRELQEISSYARSALEIALNHEDREISRRVKTILLSFPKHTHIIVDADMEPIPYAKVILTLSVRSIPGANPVPPEVESRVVGEWSDKFGRISIPDVDQNKVIVVVEVRHPDYGWGRFQVFPGIEQPEMRFPLVHQRSELKERAATGTVVAPDGQPVAGALIECHYIRTAGEGLINRAPFCGDALTDEQGRFRYYLPNDNPNRSRGDIIPPNSRYDLVISKSDDETYFPLAVIVTNAQPDRVELPRPTKRHRFRFESLTGGWMEKPEDWWRLHVEYRYKYQRVVLGSQSLIRGRPILDGTYTATIAGSGKSVQYEPVVVDQGSPEELSFRLPKAVTYRGRVVHGVTGAPVANAFVIGWSSIIRNNLALLSDDDWTLLAKTPAKPAADHPAMKLLNKYYGVQELVRTDDQGRFEIVRQPDQTFYGIMVFDQNSVPFKVSVGSLKPDAEQRIDVGEFPLFPAAKVVVHPKFDGDQLAISPEWLPTADGQPNWFDRFQEVKPGTDRDFEYVHWLTVNETQAVYVPAGVRMQLKFEAPYNDEWAPAMVEAPIQLKPGARHDVGELQFAASLMAEVLVVNSAGKPVEGFAVRRKQDSTDTWSIAHNTDDEGKAFFHVHPNSKGQFRVTDLNAPPPISEAKNLSVSFQIDEKAPKEPFRIKVTDEQIAVLRSGK